MRTAIPTIIIDGSELFRAGLKHILAKTPFRVRFARATLASLSPHRKLATDEKALLIISLSHLASSEITELSLFKQHNPQFRILALTNRPSLEECITLIDAGADGYLQRAELTPPILVNALHLIYADKAVIPQEFISGIKLAAPSDTQVSPGNGHPPSGNNGRPPNGEIQSISIPSKFSAREQEILEYLTKGASNKLIARGLNVAEATVKVHVKALLRKIQVSNRTQAAMWAITNRNNGQHLPATYGFQSESQGLNLPSN